MPCNASTIFQKDRDGPLFLEKGATFINARLKKKTGFIFVIDEMGPNCA